MAGTSISDIMQVTKLAKGGIYGNFENKDEICIEVFKYLSSRLLARTDAALNSQITTKLKLFALLDFYEGTLLSSDSGGCPILNFGTEADDTSPVITRLVNKAIYDLENRIALVISSGIERGEIKASVNAEHFAIKMYATIEGSILIGRVMKNTKKMRIISDQLKAEIELFSQ